MRNDEAFAHDEGFAEDLSDGDLASPALGASLSRELHALNDPATFVVHAQANGFSAAQAAALYHHRRLFSSPRWMHPGLWPDLRPDLIRFLHDIHAILEDVRSVNDWALGYREKVLDLAQTLSVDLDDEQLKVLLHEEELDNQCLRPSLLFGSLSRLKQGQGWSDQAPWTLEAAWGEEIPTACPDWTWDRLASALKADRIWWGDLPAPPRRWTAQHSEKWLHRLGLSESLVQVIWPWAEGRSSETGWNVLTTLRRFRQEVRRGLGSSFKGGVLGLRGRLSLGLGMTYHDSGLQSAPHCLPDRTPSLISMNSQMFPISEVLAHEWAHALDGALFQDQHQRSNPHLSWDPPRDYLSMRPDMHSALACFSADLNALRSEKGMMDWQKFRGNIRDFLKKRLDLINFDAPWHRESLEKSLLDLTVGQDHWPGMEVLLSRQAEWGGTLSALTIAAWVWQYHCPPSEGQSLWRHFNSSYVQVWPTLNALADRVFSFNPTWCEGICDWMNNRCEDWARAFEGSMPAPVGLDPEAFADPEAQADLRALVQSYLVSLKPLWDQLPFHVTDVPMTKKDDRHG